MKRAVILTAFALLGIASATIYSREPSETTRVIAVPAEDGGIKLVDAAEAARLDEGSGAESAQEPAAVGFSLPAGFYQENITLTLSAEEGKEIYFTLDGSDPAVSPKNLYGAPIEINAGSETRAVTVKAIAVSDGDRSDICTRSFVTGRGVFSRFSEDTLVFVLSTDPYNLYDYEYGIAVPGKIYDDYVKDHPGEEIPYNAPGNYYMTGREAERDIYVEVFESTGANVISQAAGVKLTGGYSRVVDQKSLKLIARKEYDPNNGKFKYPFFPDAADAGGVPISEYDRVVLRNGANDREFAGVRDELSQQLARDFGFPTTQHTTPAAVFLNGEYYGFSWLHENYNEDYLATQFGGNKKQYAIISNTEIPEEGDEKPLADYLRVTEYFDKDLTDDKIFEEFCDLVDIDNLMTYYCIEVFISNKDWPGNNYKAYRYYPAEGEEITAPEMDGRWRYLLFDAEYAWGLYGEGYKLNTLSDLLTGKHMSGESKALKALLEREDMREKFCNTMCDLMSRAFGTEHILEVLDDLTEKSDPEQFYALGKGITSTWAHEGTFADSRAQIREFAENREKVLRRQIAEVFDIPDMTYDVSVSGAKGAEAALGEQTTVGGIVYGSYYISCGVYVEAKPFDGYRFVGWDVGGVMYDEPNLRLTNDMAKDGRVSAKLIVEEVPVYGEPLKISRVSTDKNAGWITLYNPNEDAVSTAGLFLTDDETKPGRFAIPAMTIEPHGELLIVMKNNKTADALMQVQANFSLKKGETLILSDKEGNVLRSVPIPGIAEGGVYTLRDNGGYYVK